MSDVASLYLYISNTNEDIDKLFNNEQQAFNSKNMMGWFQKVWRRTTSRLIRAIVNPKVMKTPIKNP